MSREIVQTGDPVLRGIANKVPKEDFGSAKLHTLIQDMKKLLAKEKYGVALAAPQVGESLRLCIVAGTAIEKRKKAAAERGKEAAAEADMRTDLPAQAGDQVYINPELLKVSRTKTDKHEGCLSIRGTWGMVPRAEKATIRAYNERGEAFTRGASGFLAHIFQHEIDHLDGILYTDKATELFEDATENSPPP